MYELKHLRNGRCIFGELLELLGGTVILTFPSLTTDEVDFGELAPGFSHLNFSEKRNTDLIKLRTVCRFKNPVYLNFSCLIHECVQLAAFNTFCC